MGFSDVSRLGSTQPQRGLHVPVSVLTQRLHRPLVGVAAVTDAAQRNGFTAVQVRACLKCACVCEVCVTCG